MSKSQYKTNYTLKKHNSKKKINVPVISETLKHSKSTDRIYTYLIKTDFYDNSMLTKLFNDRGNWEPYDPAKHTSLDFLHIDGFNIFKRELFNIKSNLKNLVGDGKRTVVIKDNLYKNLSTIPQALNFLPWTVELDIKGKSPKYLLGFKKYFRNGRPLICKIANQGAGRNIITTDRFEVWQKFMEKKMALISKNRESPTNKWVLQEYITNPLLKNGRKFHLRLMLLYQPGNRLKYYIPLARAALAESSFKKGDWTNKDIHDTHFHRHLGLLFPTDFPEIPDKEIKSIYRQIDIISKYIIKAIQPNCYPDSKHCFEFLGLDLLITDNYQVKLIEVNEKIGISASPEYKEMIFKGVMKLVVDSYFPPLISQPNIPSDQYRIIKIK